MTRAPQGQSRAARGQLTVHTLRSDTTAADLDASGLLDATTAPPVSCVVEGHFLRGCRFLRMNGSQLRIADAEGLGVLVDAHRRLLAARGTLILTEVPSDIRTVIESAGVPDALSLIASTAEQARTRRHASTHA